MWGKARSKRSSLVLGFVLGVLLALTLVVTPAGAEPVEVGYRDFSFAASGVSAPTGQKPQSKLWYQNGSWWGALFSVQQSAFTVHRLDWATQTWSNTGAVIDTRNNARLDVLWDGTKLYVISAGTSQTSSSAALELRRFTFAAPNSYILDAGFPVTIAPHGMEAAVFDKDTAGVLWVTFTKGTDVYIAHSTVDDRTWTSPFILPVAGTQNLKTDDLSAVVAYGGRIGVMWSDQTDGAMYFASHVDGAPDTEWTLRPAVQAPEYADDHINLKSLQTDADGRVFALTKTSLNGANDPLILLLILDEQGNWQRRTVSTVADQQTRPLLLLDVEHDEIYAFTAGPCCSGGQVFYKRTSMDNPNFESGPGTPFLSSSLDPKINNISSTKQPLNSSTGLVAIAGDDSTKYYLHNAIALDGADLIPPDTQITSMPPETTPNSSATFEFTSSESGSTFECSLDGGGWTACSSPATYSVAVGPHTFEVRATDAASNTDPTPASYNWTVSDPGSSSIVTAAADTYVSASATNTNYGSRTVLVADGAGPTRIALLRFNVSGTSAISSATLRVWVPANGSHNGPEVFLTSGGWDESTVTWNTRPSPLGEMVGDAGAVANDAWLDIDVTSAVTGDGQYDFLLSQVSSDGTEFESREGGNAPRLVLTFSGGADVTPPDTFITSGPANPTTATSASFDFIANEDGSTFECRLDAGAWAGCVSPQAYTVSVGAHVFEVRATDAAGNLDPTPASYSWTVNPPDSVMHVIASADTYVADNAVNTNYGSNANMWADGSGPARIALLRFAVSGSAGTPVSATLRIWVSNGSGNGPEVYLTTDPWEETTVTWATRPAATSGLVADASSVPTGDWYEFDVTSVVTGDGVYNFLLSAISSDGTEFDSRETARPPELKLTFSP